MSLDAEVSKIWDNGQDALAEHLPRSGTNGGGPSHRIHSRGRMKIFPWSMKPTKSPRAAALRAFAEKVRTESLKLCHIHSSWLLALLWVHSIPIRGGPAPAAAAQLCTGPKALPEQQWNSSLLNIHRIVFFSKHVSMSMSTSKIAENIDMGYQSGLAKLSPEKSQDRHQIHYQLFTLTAIILQVFTSVI